jgi:hypothetical protein
MNGRRFLKVFSLAALALLALTYLLGTSPAFSKERYRGETLLEESFSVSGTPQLEIDVYDADVELISSKGSGVQVAVTVFTRQGNSEWGKEVFDRMNFQLSRSGNTVRVESAKHRISRSEHERYGGVWAKVTIHHPERIDGELYTGDGDVSLTSANGLLSVRTSDGDISLDEVHGPEIVIHTSDGDIHAGTMATKDATIETGDGDVTIDDLQGKLEARTGDGDMRVGLTEPGEVHLESGDGDIILTAPASLQADIDLRGEDVYVRGFKISGTLAGREVRGEVNGGGNLLRVRTGDGDIVLKSL